MSVLNVLDAELALARKIFWLLRDDHIFLSSYNDDSEDWDEGAYPVINCNDIFIPGADAEKLDAEDIDVYIEAVKKWPRAGPAAWCAVKRSAKPWRDFSKGRFADEYEEAVKGIQQMLDNHPKGT